MNSNQFYGFFQNVKNMPIGVQECSLYGSVFAEVYDYISVVDKQELDYYTQSMPDGGSRILEIACGSGRLTIPLLEQGYTVDAVDISESMLDRLSARLENHSAEVRERCKIYCADIYQFASEKKYDMIIIPATSICLIADTAELMQQLFLKIHDLLHPNGVFVFDFREYPQSQSANKSEVYTDFFVAHNMKWFVVFQEFNHYLKGYSVVNFYLETIQGIETHRYLCSSSKKILTQSMINRKASDTGFHLVGSSVLEHSGGITSRFLCYEK